MYACLGVPYKNQGTHKNMKCNAHGLWSMSVPPYKQVIFGTVNGAIGVMAVLSKDDFNLLLKVQHALAQVIKGVGGFRHEVRVLVYVRVHSVLRWASIEGVRP